MKLTDLAQRDPQHAMLFGRSKSGKSTLAAQLAEKGFNLIWISMDSGHRILYKLSTAAQDRIDIIVTPDTRDFPIAMDTVNKLIKAKGDTSICHLHGVVNCTPCKQAGRSFSSYNFKNNDLNTIVVLDHLTQLTDSCMAIICKSQPVDYKPKLDDWGSLRFNMLALLTEIQQAPYNILCLAQEMEAEMEDGKKLIVPQVGSREFGKSVGAFFDHIIYCDVANKSHRAGSSSTYSMSILTGSRNDTVVEGSKGAPDISPVFLNSGWAKKQLDDMKQEAIEVAVSTEKAIEILQQAAIPYQQIVVDTGEAQRQLSPSEKARAALLKLRAGKG